MIPGSANPLLLATAAVGGYQISRSLRFNSADSAYLSRTPASAGNRKTWTWAGWVKRSALGTQQFLFAISADNTDAGVGQIYFATDDAIRYGIYSGEPIVTSAVYRDASAWYHIVFTYNTANTTSGDRYIFYVNGVRQATSTYTAPSLDFEGAINRTSEHAIGLRQGNNDRYLSGYLADIHFIDGQALDPTSFGEFDATTGVWNPKAYTGTYGTNGFRLDFADNASTTTIGYDAAGSNDWTPNNLSVTAGAGNDSLVDSPTNYGTDSGVGSEVRGNYCTLNPLSTSSGTYSQGNLRFVGASNWMNSNGTFAVSTGKWYYEVTVANAPYSPRSSSSEYNGFGWAVSNVQAATTTPRTQSDAVMYGDNGYYKNFTGSNTDGGAVSSGDVLAIAVDLDANTFYLYKNNSQIATGTIGGTAGRELTPRISSYNGSYGALDVNFGQRAFAYTAPSGYKALCTANLPAPTIVKPSTVMDVKLYTANGTTNTITGLVFNPDLLWFKKRDFARHHAIIDSVRGGTKLLGSSLTDAEGTYTDMVTSFNSDGFTLGADASTLRLNENANGNQYVAWAWDGGSSTVTNTSGSITGGAQVRANASAGFSVVTFNMGSAGTYTVGHGLGVAPEFIITKSRASSFAWRIYHKTLGTSQFLQFDTGAAATSSNIWSSTAPSSTVFGIVSAQTQPANDNIVAYCFAPVAGYSSFGSYTGNGSTDGPFVYTGFRPRWLLTKVSAGDTGAWRVYDAARNTYNVLNAELNPNLSGAEYTASNSFDFLSNGFKVRTSSINNNLSNGTFIYAAFAESPFQYARAR